MILAQAITSLRCAVAGRHAWHWVCSVLLLGLVACGGGGSSPAEPVFAHPHPDLADTAPFVVDGPYAAVLKPCASAVTESASCTLEVLPLLGQETSTPTIAGVMERVLVSHAWMGERFAQVLALLPPDMLELLKGVTAIVIDADVRPSFYSAGTAAIYIDPAFLWLTNEEKATISRAPDFRSDFGSSLQFVYLWRYVLGSDYAYRSFSLGGTETRQLADILYPVAALLYHELAHANDFLPPALQPTLDLQLKPLAAVGSAINSQVTTQLIDSLPLTSALWTGLAQVLFLGSEATLEQRGYSAEFVGAAMEGDGASDAYNYTNTREDVAMLFEETMMKFHYDIDRDLGFSALPTTDTPVCDDFVVGWGVRNRLGDPVVKARAELVAAALLPEADLNALFAAFPAPAAMTPGLGWCSNLTLGAPVPLGAVPHLELLPEQLTHDRVPPAR